MIGQLRKLLAIPGMDLLHVALVCVLCLASARAADGPELYLSLQGVADETVAQGEPLRVAVLIETGAESTWLLAPASGTWADAVAVEILAADSDTAVARAQAAGQPDEATATVDGERVAGGLWRFPADAVQALPPGAYRLRAALAISDGPGWHGTAASDELPLTVLPPSDDPARAAQKTLALAQDALLSGDPQAAAKILDEELGRDPAQFRPLLLRAIIAEQAGNPLAAQWLLNLAELGNPVEPGSYPNVDFEETRARVLAALLNPAPGSPLPEPPAWSWPPVSVLDALRELDARRWAGRGGRRRRDGRSCRRTGQRRNPGSRTGRCR